jgi:hypothetical protein
MQETLLETSDEDTFCEPIPTVLAPRPEEIITEPLPMLIPHPESEEESSDEEEWEKGGAWCW